MQQLREMIETVIDEKLRGYVIRPRAAPKKINERKFVFPEWLEPNRDVWDAWVEARTRAKHPPTDWAKFLAVSKLEQMKLDGHNVRRLLADAAFHNWQSFYVTKDQ